MFCLSGKGSTLSTSIFPAIDLSEGDWEIGLVDFTTYNSIPNVEEGVNNRFYYGTNKIQKGNDKHYEYNVTDDKDDGIVKIVEIPTGSYELDDITHLISEQINEPGNLKIRGNNSTFKVEIFSRNKVVDFTNTDSIGLLLGYSPRCLEPNKYHVSDLPVDIIKVNVIRIECNLVRGSYQNGIEGHIIHEFYPAVPPGFKIIETPRHVIYLPVSVKKLENIIVTFTDQDNRLINFREETINVRLHLRKKHGSSIRY